MPRILNLQTDVRSNNDFNHDNDKIERNFEFCGFFV